MNITYDYFECPKGFIGRHSIEIPDEDLSVHGLTKLESNPNLFLTVESLGNIGQGLAAVSLTDEVLQEDIHVLLVPDLYDFRADALIQCIAFAATYEPEPEHAED